MASVVVNDAYLEDIADAIRAKLNSQDTYKPSEMASAIGSISGGTTPTGTKQISITQNGTTTENVAEYASAEITVNVSASGFTIDDIVMNVYGGATDIVLPNATCIVPFAFKGLPITSLSAPNVVRFSADRNVAGIGQGVCWGCTSLTSISFPNLENTGSGGDQFRGCTGLTTVNLPKANTGARMFYDCTNLVTAVIGGTSGANGEDFRGCTKLKTCDTKMNKINGKTFYGCTVFDKLILRNSSVASLSNIDAFYNTCFASGKSGGTLYVPNSLISSYQSASNWSTILGYTNNQITKIEGTIYETQYADGTSV